METCVKIKLAMAEDHVLFREGLTARLSREEDIEIIGQFANGKELLEFLKNNYADIVLMDIQMPEMDGISATKIIAEMYSETKVVALTMFENDNSLTDMLHAGARGYLLKNSDYKEMIEVIYDVYEGKKAYSLKVYDKIAQLLAQARYHPRAKTPALLPVEIDIIKLICKGYSAKDIAEKLKMSIRTIEGFKSKILVKLDVKNTNAVVVFAIRNKIVDIEDL